MNQQIPGGSTYYPVYKNNIEAKAIRCVLVEENVFDQGWVGDQQNNVVFKAAEYGRTENVEVRWNKFLNTTIPVAVAVANNQQIQALAVVSLRRDTRQITITSSKGVVCQGKPDNTKDVTAEPTANPTTRQG